MEVDCQKSRRSHRTPDIYNVPLDVWYIILSHLSFQELIQARAVSKRIGKLISSYIKHGTTYYRDELDFLEYETYRLFDILMRNELCWTRVKTKLGKWAMKMVILNGAYTHTVLGKKKFYNHYIRTRCATYQDYKSTFKEGSEEHILTLWGKYKHSSWYALSNVGISILQMECQFDQYIKKLYLDSYGTWLPITFDQRKIQEVQNVITYEERMYKYRLQIREQSNIRWMKYTTR